MNKPADAENPYEEIRQKIIGLGESSARKSYYPLLQQRLADLERFRTLLDHSRDLIFTVRLSDGVIQDANAALGLLIGRAPASLSLQDIFPPSLCAAIHNISENTPAAQLVRLVHLPAASGEQIPLEISLTPLRFGGEQYVVVVGREIGERLRAEQEIQRQVRRMADLHRIDVAITGKADLAHTLALILEVGQEHLQAAAGCVWQHDPTTASYELLAARGLDLRRASHHPFLTPLSTAASEKNPQLKAVTLQGVTYLARTAVPLRLSGELKGLLEFYHATPPQADPNWGAFLDTLTTETLIAIENAELLEGLRQSNRELKEAYDATLEGWSSALGLREREAGAHTRRVTLMSVRLARRLGLSEDAVDNIRRGALLHDVGKMAIPDHILLKPEGLSEEEWQLVRRHPDFARQMLEPVSFLRGAMDIPRFHHERWDGSGYPYGLKGEQIPVAARIFAIIDVWDSLLSDRPYRPAWPAEEVLKYLRLQSGQSFDPELIPIFLDLLQNPE